MGRTGPRNGKEKAGWHEYSSRGDAERAVFKEILTMGLVEASSDPGAEMHWTVLTFRDRVLFFYRLLLVGWPRDIMFCNPSTLNVGEVQRLLALYAQHRLYFRQATAGDVLVARESLYNACPGLTFRAPPPETCRSNLGEWWARPMVDRVKYPQRRARKGPKSRRWVGSDSE
ncbi:hypothetical protein C8Q80DRAFT_1272006 [Daedaleopsis nitida]|nr:hypothetical protein C8Q80DRAFT_1272006 [Daedaleopsis nitida]